MDLGSGVKIDIPIDGKKVKILRKPKKEKEEVKQNYPKTPSPTSVTMVDGIEIKVERLPIRYETLESVMDDLPDFCVEILDSLYSA